MKKISAASIFFLVSTVATARIWYVSPTGSGSAYTRTSPGSLTTLFASSTLVQPGDTIYLRCGCTAGVSEYSVPTSGLISNMLGSVSNQIIVDTDPLDRATPWTYAVINGNTGTTLPPPDTLRLSSNYVTYRHVEFYNGPNPLREFASSSAADPPGFGDGIHVVANGTGTFGIGNKIQNSILHDMAQGISKNSRSHLDEISGVVVYYPGFNDKTLAGGSTNISGHGMYLQHGTLGNDGSPCNVASLNDNNPPTALITNSIIYPGFEGYQEYGSCGGCAMHKNINLQKSWIQGNFLAGGCAGGAGGLLGPTNMTIDKVIFAGAQGMAYNGSGCTNVTMTNSIVGKYPEGAMFGGAFDITSTPLPCKTSMAMTGNTFYPRFNGWTSSDFPSNTFLPDNGVGPGPNFVSVYPNPSEAGRCEVFIVNGSLLNNVTVNLTACGLTEGSQYEVKLAVNQHGAALVSGTYHAASPTASFPMTGLTAPVALGHYLDGTSWDTGGPSHNIVRHINYASPAVRAPFIVAQVAGGATPTPSNTATSTVTPSSTPTPTFTGTLTPTPTFTLTPTGTLTPTPTPTPTNTPTDTPTSTPTATPTVTATVTPPPTATPLTICVTVTPSLNAPTPVGTCIPITGCPPVP